MLDKLHVVFPNGSQDNLHGSKPERERSGVMLDQHAHEPLERTRDRAMDHHRPFLFSVGIGILELEALRQVKVELNGGKLPLASDRIFGNKINLGTVECRLANRLRIRKTKLLQEASQDFFRPLPDFPPAEIFFRLCRIRKRKSSVQRHAELRVKRLDDFINRAALVHNLIGTAKHMRVILRDRTHAGETLKLARILVAVHRRDLGIPQRKITVGTRT